MAGMTDGPAPDEPTKFELLNPLIRQRNLVTLSDARGYLSMLSGSVCGILGLTGLSGVALFGALHAVAGASLWIGTMGGDVKRHTGLNTAMTFILMDVQKCLMSYMLFWTMGYGLVYLF